MADKQIMDDAYLGLFKMTQNNSLSQDAKDIFTNMAKKDIHNYKVPSHNQDEPQSNYHFKLYHPDIKDDQKLHAELEKRKEEKDKQTIQKQNKKVFLKLRQMLKFYPATKLLEMYPEQEEILLKVIKHRNQEIKKTKLLKPQREPLTDRQVSQSENEASTEGDQKQEFNAPFTWENLEKLSYKDLGIDVQKQDLKNYIAKSTKDDDFYLAEYQLTEQEKTTINSASKSKLKDRKEQMPPLQSSIVSETGYRKLKLNQHRQQSSSIDLGPNTNVLEKATLLKEYGRLKNGPSIKYNRSQSYHSPKKYDTQIQQQLDTVHEQGSKNSNVPLFPTIFIDNQQKFITQGRDQNLDTVQQKLFSQISINNSQMQNVNPHELNNSNMYKKTSQGQNNASQMYKNSSQVQNNNSYVYTNNQPQFNTPQVNKINSKAENNSQQIYTNNSQSQTNNPLMYTNNTQLHNNTSQLQKYNQKDYNYISQQPINSVQYNNNSYMQPQNANHLKQFKPSPQKPNYDNSQKHPQINSQILIQDIVSNNKNAKKLPDNSMNQIPLILINNHGNKPQQNRQKFSAPNEKL